MEDLSHRVGTFPPTSQSAGNTTSDAAAAMTAPGSMSEDAPTPSPFMGMDIPSARRPTVLHPGGSPSQSPWTSAGGVRPWVASADGAAPADGNVPDSASWEEL
jgi:hypothetical protein